MRTEPPEDPHRVLLRERLTSMLHRAERASSWAGRLAPLRALVNRDGHVPVRAKLAVEDLDLLATAREELLCLGSLLLRLLDLHQPRDAGGITSDAARPILRCRSCMWRWPCPTFRALAESLLGSRPAAPRTEPPSAPGAAGEGPAEAPSGERGLRLGRQGPSTDRLSAVR
ncbi:hypothetical protein AB0K60_32645 [Thermopolyspora sp. NPDC052614]|uniref:hypothetical protein n=1 Tax=Thermopolyspora sp. NPDC052614 TaxID=3155682 RepID=UPI0034472735